MLRYPAGDVGPQRKGPEEQRQLVVRARVVVAAAGALHTPALLLRSGEAHTGLGRGVDAAYIGRGVGVAQE